MKGEWATAALAALAGALSAGVTWVVNRQPQKADYADRLLDATIPAAEMLAKRLAAVEAKVEVAEQEVLDCERRFRVLNAKHDHLIQWLAKMDLEVPPMPN